MSEVQSLFWMHVVPHVPVPELHAVWPEPLHCSGLVHCTQPPYGLQYGSDPSVQSR